MRAGLVIDTGGEPGDIAGQAGQAERLGFDLAAATEHVFFDGPVSNAFITLAAMGLGHAEECLRAATSYARDREVFGSPLISLFAESVLPHLADLRR